MTFRFPRLACHIFTVTNARRYEEHGKDVKKDDVMNSLRQGKMACHSVGFNVVHHLTDLPKVLSGDQLLHFL